MNVIDCQDDELAEAMYAWLLRGPAPDGRPLVVRGKKWMSPRDDTARHFALRFPRCMDKEGKKKGK